MSDDQLSQPDLGVHLQSLVDTAPRVIVVIDAKGEILWVGRASETLIGRPGMTPSTSTCR